MTGPLRITKTHKKIISLIDDSPARNLIPYEISKMTGILEKSASRRLTELKKMGHIIDTKIRRKNANGNFETAVTIHD